MCHLYKASWTHNYACKKYIPIVWHQYLKVPCGLNDERTVNSTILSCLACLRNTCTKYVPLVCDNISEHIDFTESQNPVYPEALIHNTSFGLKVRPKSEAMIADSLYMFNVPLFHEQKLVLTDAFGQPYDIYPDFTFPPSDGSSIYWEHKGRMDDSKYRQRNQWKESLYFINGIYPPHNLITTMDGPNQEFDLQEIHRVIKGLILPRLGK